MIFLVDFAGTLIRAEAIEEANKFRSMVLKRSLPSTDEHANPDILYKANREFVGNLTGLTDSMTIKYRKNDLEFMEIPAEQYKNQISTNLFQIGMFMIAKAYGNRIFPDGLITELVRIKKLGYKLAIISGVRTDIISGMLQISEAPIEFDYIVGQPPVLGVSNSDNIKYLKKFGKVKYAIGDKYDDLQSAKATGAKLIWATWGHSSGKEKEIADYTISRPDELKKIIKK